MWLWLSKTEAAADLDLILLWKLQRLNAPKLKKFAEHLGWRKKQGNKMKQALDYVVFYSFAELKTDDFEFNELVTIFIEHFGVDHVNPKLSSTEKEILDLSKYGLTE